MLSRARALYFKHNDMADLERVLQKVAAEDRRQQCVTHAGLILPPACTSSLAGNNCCTCRHVQKRVSTLEGISYEAGQPQVSTNHLIHCASIPLLSARILKLAGAREAGS